MRNPQRHKLQRWFPFVPILLIPMIVIGLMTSLQATGVEEANGKFFITDQKGERWEVTQAVGLGFRPEGFQFGIGRNAIRPLDDNYLKTQDNKLPEAARVIGVVDDESGDAHAYSIRRLTRHEIANTRLGETPIAAAY